MRLPSTASGVLEGVIAIVVLILLVLATVAVVPSPVR